MTAQARGVPVARPGRPPRQPLLDGGPNARPALGPVAARLARTTKRRIASAAGDGARVAVTG